MPNFSTAVIIETRNPLKERGLKGKDLFPVKLRVIINRKARYYGLDEYLTQDQFKGLFSQKADKETKKLASKLLNEQEKAIDILNAMETPNFDQFKRLFTQKGTGGNVLKYYESYIAECKKAGRVGTASNYQCSLESLKNVKGIDKANFRDITQEWLKDYENQMKAKGKSVSTIGAYLRPLRYLFNRALIDGVIMQKHYPFGKGKYKVQKSKKNPRPLELDELIALLDYSGSAKANYYRDFFLLSYYLVGLNPADIVSLKWNQLKGNVLTLVRQKTRDTASESKPISLILEEPALDIIQRHGNPAGELIFSIINPKDTAAEKKRKKDLFIRNTNQALKAVAKELGINEDISLIYARHSAASHAIKNGVNLATLSKSLGHSNIQQTSTYISSLGIEGQRELAQALNLKSNRSKNGTQNETPSNP